MSRNPIKALKYRCSILLHIPILLKSRKSEQNLWINKIDMGDTAVVLFFFIALFMFLGHRKYWNYVSNIATNQQSIK